jgi:hypothetical protein
MALTDISLYDAYGKFFQFNTHVDEQYIQTLVDSAPRAAGAVRGIWDPVLYFWDGDEIASTTDMTPTVTAYQTPASIVTTMANLPARCRAVVTPPQDLGLANYVVVDPVDDGQIAFSANVDGIYQIQLDAPKFADYFLEIQVGSVALAMDVNQFTMNPLAMTCDLIPIAVSVKTFTETTLSVNINANTNIQPAAYSIVQTAPELNINARTTIAMATNAILQTFLSCAVDDVIEVPVSLYSFTQTTLVANINAEYYIQLEDSLYVPVRVYEVNIALDDTVTVDVFAFTETSPVHTVA